MDALVVFEQCFRWMAEHGIWDLVTATAVVVIATALRYRSRRPNREVSIQVTHSFGNDHGAFPNTLGFELRNLLDAPIIITRPSFRFSKYLVAGSGAHVDSVSGDVEMKFRILMPDGQSASQLSHVTAMLRHREGAFAFVPVQDSLSEDAFLKIAGSRRIGTLELDVVLLGESPPRSMSWKMPIRLTQRAAQPHTFGADGLAQSPKRASVRPPALPVPAE